MPKPNAKILDIGAGTGRYSHVLAKLGYSVDAVELIQHNIDIFKSHLSSNENITVRQGDARDLSMFEDNKYDITLVLGPMYHLYSEEDKIKTIAEALRVTKKGGVVFVAYCITDHSIFYRGFKCGFVFDLVNKAMLDTKTFKAHSEPSDVFELVRKEDIDILMSQFNVDRLHYVSVDLLLNFMRETLDNMDDETFDLYMKYHFFLCERLDMAGLTGHSLDIFRKRQ